MQINSREKLQDQDQNQAGAGAVAESETGPTSMPIDQSYLNADSCRHNVSKRGIFTCLSLPVGWKGLECSPPRVFPSASEAYF